MKNNYLKRLRLLPAAMLLVCWGGTALSQLNSLNADTHAIIGARAAALGDAYASEAYDASTIYWNPAGLPYVFYTQVVASFASEKLPTNDILTTENVAVPLPRFGDWTFGLGGTLHQIGSLDSQSPLKGLKYSQVGFDVAVARVIIPALSVGGAIRARYAKNNYSSLWAASGSLGVFYAPQPGVTYGFIYQGMGSGINYPYYETTDVFDLRRGNIPRTFQAGLSMRYPQSPTEQQVVTICFTNQKIIGVSGLEYKMGVEVFPFPFLALRGGYWTGPVSSAAKIGGGIRLGSFQFDYAYAGSSQEPKFHQFTIAFTLPTR
jgi:hypothetical protein